METLKERLLEKKNSRLQFKINEMRNLSSKNLGSLRVTSGSKIGLTSKVASGSKVTSTINVVSDADIKSEEKKETLGPFFTNPTVKKSVRMDFSNLNALSDRGGNKKGKDDLQEKDDTSFGSSLVSSSIDSDGIGVQKKSKLYDNLEKEWANNFKKDRVREYNDMSYKVTPHHINGFLFDKDVLVKQKEFFDL